MLCGELLLCAVFFSAARLRTAAACGRGDDDESCASGYVYEPQQRGLQPQSHRLLLSTRIDENLREDRSRPGLRRLRCVLPVDFGPSTGHQAGPETSSDLEVLVSLPVEPRELTFVTIQQRWRDD